MKKILLVATLDITFKYILKDQPSILGKYFSVVIGSSNYIGIKKYAKSQSVNFIHIPMVRRINPVYDIFSIYCLIKHT